MHMHIHFFLHIYHIKIDINDILFYSAFDQYIYLKTDTKIYTLYHYNIIYDIALDALEQAYRSLCKLGSNYIHIHLCTKSISIKV